LSSIHEARAQALFEKMNDCLRHSPSRLDTLTLLGHIVRKQVLKKTIMWKGNLICNVINLYL